MDNTNEPGNGGAGRLREGVQEFTAWTMRELEHFSLVPDPMDCEIRLCGSVPKGSIAVRDGSCHLVLEGTERLGREADLALSAFRGMLDVHLRDHEVSLPEGARLAVVLRTKGKEGAPAARESGRRKFRDGEEPGTAYVPQTPRFDFSKIVLPEGLMADIRRALGSIRYRDLIYREWGFAKVDPSAKAILNFYGPPGTGKTMTAHAIAAELGLKILVMNYADIESKFVGDAPKNLKRAFETAARENALLFFDEADSFLGKRITSVSTSSDQAVNSLRSQMLIFLENFGGVVVFCTNLVKNYDRAFETRILAHLKFELPDESQRAEIYRKSIPEEVPFEQGARPTDEQFTELARLSEGLSGRDIRNAVLWALTGAAVAGRRTLAFGDFDEGTRKIKEQKERLAKESGKLTPAAQQKVAGEIRDKLKSGDYQTAPAPEGGNSEPVTGAGDSA